MLSPNSYWIHRSFILALLVSLAATLFVPATVYAADTNPPSPVQLSAEEDHRRLMELMHMDVFRRRRDVNYDESLANPYPDLPDPLILNNGKKVTTARQWWKKRRPEIVEDFDREIYGRLPKKLPTVHWEVASVTNRIATNAYSSFEVIEKRLLGHVDNSSYTNISVTIQLSLILPAHPRAPSPVIMVLTAGPRLGVTTLSAGRNAAGAGTNTLARRAGPGGFGGNRGLQPWQAMALSNGWGYATLNTYSIQADGGAGLTAGIIGLCNKGQPRKLDDWGVLRAWAWGASRALDYFQTDKAVNAKQVGLEGHSRWGKATAVAMAYDPRFAIAYSSSSGQGGAKINRRNYGEVTENAAFSEAYHWYAGNFIKYGAALTAKDLPVDGHELIALCAPRPVFIGSGNTLGGNAGDGFADPRGMFMAAVDAGPVYRLLGKKDLGTYVFPPPDTALTDGDIAFRAHSGGHTDGPNWPAFLSFAERYLKKLRPKSMTPASGNSK